jgi:hypothetical protein
MSREVFEPAVLMLGRFKNVHAVIRFIIIIIIIIIHLSLSSTHWCPTAGIMKDLMEVKNVLEWQMAEGNCEEGHMVS